MNPEVLSVTLDSSTAPLGGAVTGTMEIRYDAPDVNSNIVVDILGYFSGRGEQVIGTGTLRDGTVTINWSIPVPDDQALLGEQWIYVGFDAGSTSSLKGRGVTIVEQTSSSGGSSSDDQDQDSSSSDGSGSAVTSEAGLALIGVAAVAALAWSRRS